MIVVVVVAAETEAFRPVLTSGIAHGWSDVVAVTVIVGVVGVQMVVPVVGGPVMVRTMPRMIAVIPVSVRMIPSPSVVEPIVIPSVIIIVRTIVVAWPPPVVTHVNA